MSDLYDIARRVTDEVLGEGTYEEINKNNPDPSVQAAIRRAPLPTKKIAELDPKETCTHREHLPPHHRVYEPGVYEHTCPSCGQITTFTIRNPWE